jgi:hypothetical protein
MGPLNFLLERGANVIAIVREGKEKWEKILSRVSSTNGKLIFPVS